MAYQPSSYTQNQTPMTYQPLPYAQNQTLAVDQCVHNHDPAYGQNYPWLEALGHGRLMRTWFKEPADKKEFTLYDSHWWDEHCQVVSHGENLYQSHVNTFTGPQRTIAMFFEFEDGQLVEAEPYHYALEHYHFNGVWPAGYAIK